METILKIIKYFRLQLWLVFSDFLFDFWNHIVMELHALLINDVNYLYFEFIIYFSEFNQQRVFLQLLLNGCQYFPRTKRHIVRMRSIHWKRFINSTNELIGFQLSFYLVYRISNTKLNPVSSKARVTLKWQSGNILLIIVKLFSFSATRIPIVSLVWYFKEW